MRFFAPLAVFGLVATSIAAPTPAVENEKRDDAATLMAAATKVQSAITPYSSQLSAAAASMPADSSDPLSALTSELANVLFAGVTQIGEITSADGLLSASNLASALDPVFTALQDGLAAVNTGIRSAMAGGSVEKRDVAELEDMSLILRKDTLTDYLNAKNQNKPLVDPSGGWGLIGKRQSLSVQQLDEILGEITSLISPTFNELADLFASLGLPAIP